MSRGKGSTMKKEIKISASRASTFLSCRKKYWFSYKDKKLRLSNPSFKMGISCHGALEMAGRMMMEKGEFVLTKNEQKKVYEEYDRLSVEENIDDLELHKEGRDLVKKGLNTFLSGDRVIGVEVSFGMEGSMYEEVFLGDVPVVGVIDKVEEINGDTLIIEDYKTSKTFPTYKELREDFQLSMYDMVARKLWPGYDRYVLCLNFLKGERMFTYRTDEDREAFQSHLHAIYKSMKSLKKEDAVGDVDMLCAWCDFRGDCEEYTKACDEACFFKGVDISDVSGVAEEWIRIKDTKKLLEKREGELSMILMENINKYRKNIETDDKVIYQTQRATKAYDTDKVIDLMTKEDLKHVCKIKSSALEKYVEDKPIRDKVLSFVELNQSSPYLSSRKRKKK